MKENRINQYWSDFFGIEVAAMNGAGVLVVPHAYLEGYEGAWIFRRKNQVIVSVPPKIVPHISAKIGGSETEKDDVFSKPYLEELFDGKIERIIGPVYQGYYDGNGTGIEVSKEVSKINFEEYKESIEELSKSGDESGWTHSGINEKSDAIYAYFYEGKIESIASCKISKEGVGFVGVYTNPACRGKGLSAEVVKKLVKDLSAKGILIRYQTLASNIPSVKVAQKIGFEEYARNIAIRLQLLKP